MKKFLYIFITFFITSSAFANQPVDWQLGFQKAASETMRDIVNFHDKLLLPNYNSNQCFCTIFDGLCLYKI